MKITMMALSKLKPYDNNPRLNDQAVGAVIASIKKFGWQQPIVVDKKHVIIVGHTRFKAANAMGLEEVPVVVADMAEDDARAYRIADNQTGAIATFDWDKLKEELAALQEEGFEMDSIGFTPGELDAFLGKESDPTQEGDPDNIPPLPMDDPITKRGDIIILGRHRLMCGDSSDRKQLDKLLNGAKIQLVNTDPPYNVAVEPRSNNAIAAGFTTFPSGQGAHLGASDLARHPEKSKATHKQLRAKDRPLDNDAMTEKEFDAILRKWFGNIAYALEPGRGWFIWGGYGNSKNYRLAMDDTGLYFSQAVIWDKMHPVLGRKDFMNSYEVGYYGWKEGAAHQWFGPNNVSDLWHIKKMHHTQTIHLTEKPVELAERAMEYCSQRGENVLDLFGGSGSTLIAAERKDRNAFLMELDPCYADGIVLRWEQLTGKKAIRNP